MVSGAHVVLYSSDPEQIAYSFATFSGFALSMMAAAGSYSAYRLPNSRCIL